MAGGWVSLKKRAAGILVREVESGVFALKHRISGCKVEAERWGRIRWGDIGRRGRKIVKLLRFGLKTGVERSVMVQDREFWRI